MSNPYGPLTEEEIQEILGATLHGPLPTKTMHRVFATLAEYLELRKAVKKAIKHDKGHWSDFNTSAEGVKSILKYALKE